MSTLRIRPPDRCPEEPADEPDPRAGERGQGMIEYALIISLIVLVVIVLVIVLGHQTNNLYSNINNGLKLATG